MLERPFRSLDGWVSYLGRLDLPVLRRTAAALESLRERADSVSGREIAAVVLQDPLMTLKVLAYLESHRSPCQNHDVTTIERALMMLGVERFFRSFPELQSVETQLEAWPKALIGVLRVIGRARNASRFARDWAQLRYDIDVDEVTVAALLYDCLEVALWCSAPSLALAIRREQDEHPGLRSHEAQRLVLGVTLGEIQRAVARAWHLPQLLARLMDDSEADNPRAQNVVLAVNLARHLANGWEDPAVPDDLAAVQRLLRIPEETLLARLGAPTLPGPDLPASAPLNSWPQNSQSACTPPGRSDG